MKCVNGQDELSLHISYMTEDTYLFGGSICL